MYLILCAFITLLHGRLGSSSSSNSHEWDLLIFTQSWPITVCMEWKEDVPSHMCNLPSPTNEWTIHGIWPTKLGTIGPSFCNSSWHFNRNEIEPIESSLEKHWTNIHTGNRYNLWEHEWNKHGTCATSVPSLASEINYFSQGLKWIDKYNMNKILESVKIMPDGSIYDAKDLFYAVRKELGVDPDVQCIQNKKTGYVYLLEIRICFTKSLVLTDCDGIKSRINNKTVITNCPPNKAIIYPSKVPPVEKIETLESKDQLEKPRQVRMPWLLDVLYFVQWLQWLTL